MPWKNQSGGPWGSGPRGPWGSGPQPSGPSTPDFEDIIRRVQERVKSLLPGGSLGGRGTILIVLLIFVIWMVSGFYRVQLDEQGVVLRFGKFVQLTQPGLNYHWPYPIETALTPQVTTSNRIDVGMRIVEDPRRGGTTMRDEPGARCDIQNPLVLPICPIGQPAARKFSGRRVATLPFILSVHPQKFT